MNIDLWLDMSVAFLQKTEILFFTDKKKKKNTYCVFITTKTNSQF